ncbi:hypothetical protein BGW80DRAFT_1253827 [Lactifluus volemus]|nr:hypothetical protein BGW80DRAFT_1253827 [Lactifluus volemus]
MLELASWDFSQWACIALCKEVLIYMKCADHRGTGSAEDVFATAPAPPVANYDPSSAPAAPARVFKKDSFFSNTIFYSGSPFPTSMGERITKNDYPSLFLGYRSHLRATLYGAVTDKTEESLAQTMPVH